jgi:cobalamin biosynthesis protein CbiG
MSRPKRLDNLSEIIKVFIKDFRLRINASLIWVFIMKTGAINPTLQKNAFQDSGVRT